MPLPLIAGVSTTASASLASQHAVGDLAPQSMLSFISGSLPFTALGAPLAADALAVGDGVSGCLGEAVEVSLSDADQRAANANENAVKGAFIGRFRSGALWIAGRNPHRGDASSYRHTSGALR